MASARRQIDAAAISSLAPVAALLPIWIIAISIWWIPFWLWTDVSLPLFAFATLAMGVILFSKPVQKIFLTRLLGARQPTTIESELLQKPWRRVCQANHLDTDSFVLAVVDSSEANAFASGGHLVVVSSLAVHQLCESDLSGVLAHELSHHLGSHTVALTIAQWLSLPVLVLARIGFLCQRAADRVAEIFSSRFAFLKFFGLLVSATLTVVSSVFVAGLVIAQALGNAVGHLSEMQADRRVVHMGFGNELCSALRSIGDGQRFEKVRQLGSMVISSHPNAQERISQMETLLRTEDPFR